MSGNRAGHRTPTYRDMVLRPSVACRETGALAASGRCESIRSCPDTFMHPPHLVPGCCGPSRCGTRRVGGMGNRLGASRPRTWMRVPPGTVRRAAGGLARLWLCIAPRGANGRSRHRTRVAGMRIGSHWRRDRRHGDTEAGGRQTSRSILAPPEGSPPPLADGLGWEKAPNPAPSPERDTRGIEAGPILDNRSRSGQRTASRP